MKNPWTKKNPFLSMWLSAANSVGNTARVRATAQAKRQTTTAVNQATKDIVGFWTGASAATNRSTKRRRPK